MTRKFNVVGVDPSLSHTAGHVLLDHGVDAVDSRPFSIKGELKKFPSPIARLAFMRDRFVAELRTVAHSEPLVVIEGYAFGSKFAREQMGELGGVYRLAAYDLGLSVLIVPPTTLKKFVTGKGSAEKDAIRMFCLKKWNYESVNNDDGDAYALMRLGLEYLRHESGQQVPKLSVELFAKLEIVGPAPARLAA